MSLAETETSPFYSSLQTLQQMRFKMPLFGAYQQLAWDKLTKLGEPQKKDGRFRSLKLRHILAQKLHTASAPSLTNSWSHHVLPEAGSHLVFINGRFQPALSTTHNLGKLVILPLHEALKNFGPLVQTNAQELVKNEEDPFSLANSALHEEGLFIYVPPGTVVEHPIQILLVHHQNEELSLSLPRISIFLGKKASAKFIITSPHLTEHPVFDNSLISIRLDDAANLHLVDMVDHAPTGAFHFHTYRAEIKRDSTLKTIFLSPGSDTTRFDVEVKLQGENSEVNLNGLWMLSGKKECHHHVHIEHVAPCCRSLQLFKGALGGTSRSSFQGKIVVQQEAQKTEAYQLNNNLLLSPNAHADSKPNLKIFADDVKASHGATIGQLDQEQLFYLSARGIPAYPDGQALLLRGFCQEVIDLIPYPTLQTQARTWQT